MDARKLTAILVSDFTIDNLAGYLDNDPDLPNTRSSIAPFNQVMQVLMDKNMSCWQHNHDFAVVWTQPENIISSFSRILDFGVVPLEDIIKEVDEYSSQIVSLLDRVNVVFVPTWITPSFYRCFGMLDMKPDVGPSHTLMQMNLRLSEKLSSVNNVFLLNSQKWIDVSGKNSFSPRGWYLGKIPYSNAVFKEATKDIKSALAGVAGYSRKLIVLDLDDTLWGGIIGDDGIENIRLGGHDPIGEAYADFQRALKTLVNRGIILAIVSKNEASIALEAIEKHPEMVLRLDDFAGWRINWEDKANNIVDLVSELNLGLQSVVFIDDNPAERERVRSELPEVLIPEWPEDKMLYRSSLLSLRCFNLPSLSREDLDRSRMYLSERKRKSVRKRVSSIDEWLRSLHQKVIFESLNETNLQRATQLLNKTNQMNLITRRLSEQELQRWSQETINNLWVLRVSDKFGDSGLTGIVSFETQDEKANIIDFVLSCRVMGRKVEEIMLHKVIEHARFLGLQQIRVKYVATPKNKPCKRFLENSDLDRIDSDTFSWEINKKYKTPDYIKIETI